MEKSTAKQNRLAKSMQNRRRKIRHRKNRLQNRWKIHRKNKIDKKSSTKVNKSCILSPAPLPGSGTGRAAGAAHLRPPEVGASDRRSERTLRRTNFLTPFNRKSGSGTGTLAVLFLAFGHNRSEGSMSAWRRTNEFVTAPEFETILGKIWNFGLPFWTP